MADYHHHQPTTTTTTAVAYPSNQIADSIAFLNEILAELEASPAVRNEFLTLLSGLGKHGGDHDAVGSRAAVLLRGHPDVRRRFTAHVHMDVVPAEDDEGGGLALTTPPPRRSSRSRRKNERREFTQQQTPPAAVAHGDDGGGGLWSADADGRALAFVKRVHDTAGPVVHDKFLAVLSEAAERGEEMFADEIYGKAKQAFGPAHVGLLHAFATAWLPGEQQWKLQQQQQQARAPPARQRSRTPAAGLPDAKKKPRAADDGDANGRRQHDHVIAVLEVVRNTKKRRRDDDDGAGDRALRRVGESSGVGGGAAAAQGRDDDYDYDYAPRSRAKKHRGGNGEFSGTAARVVLGAVATAGGVHHAYSGDNDKKPPRRRAATGGMGSGVGAEQQQQADQRDGDEVRRFRQEWEFQTYYSKLVATSDRVTELLPARTPHGDGGGGNHRSMEELLLLMRAGHGGGGFRSLEELFPLAECREFLRSFYGVRWREMRAALESGESRVPALVAIARGLRKKDEEAVAEESRKRRRHDPARVAQRLHGLAMDTMGEEERRHYGGGA